MRKGKILVALIVIVIVIARPLNIKVMRWLFLWSSFSSLNCYENKYHEKSLIVLMELSL
jgi:hypothetical protein